MGPRLLLVSLLAAAAPARAAAAEFDEALFTFGTMSFAAASIASDADRAPLRDYQLLPIRDEVADAAHPLRRAVAQAVAAWPLPLKRRALDYFRANAWYSTVFHAFVVESFGPPPAFAPRDQGPSMEGGSPAIFARRAELAALLGAAHQAGAAALWRAHQQEWAADQLSAATVDETKRAVIAYFRWPSAAGLPAFDAIFDPLMAPGTGINAQLARDRVLLLFGALPPPRGREMILAHEFAHRPMDVVAHRPAVARALADAACAFRRVDRNFGYRTWENYVTENLIRNLSYRVTAVPDRSTGFLFESFFAWKLREYESESVSFDRFLILALAELKRQFC